jgi:nucleoside-diphosphate-sugar epimerase
MDNIQLNDFPRYVLITGASGFIGQAFVRRLLKSQAWQSREGRCFIVGRTCHPIAPAVTSIQVDLRNELSDTFLPEYVDIIVHLATPRQRGDDSPASFPEQIRVNLDATARLYDWARRHDVPAVVHVSTTSVFTPAQDPTLTLTDDSIRVDTAAHPYSLSKRWAEDLAAAYRQTCSVTIIRPAHVYGPGLSKSGTGLGQAAQQLLRGEPLVVARPDGHRLTPVFIDDVVSVLAWTMSHPGNHTFSVAGPDALYERQLLAELAVHLGVPAKIEETDAEQPVSLAISTERIDALYPQRPRTPWSQGIMNTFPRIPTK